jgi:TPR repeat protein
MALLGCLHRFGKIDSAAFPSERAAFASGAAASQTSPQAPPPPPPLHHPLHLAEAFGWFLKAADFGHPGAEGSLAVLCLQGLGTARSNKVAWRWLRKAARDANATAPPLPEAGDRGAASAAAAAAAQFGLPFMYVERALSAARQARE